MRLATRRVVELREHVHGPGVLLRRRELAAGRVQPVAELAGFDALLQAAELPAFVADPRPFAEVIDQRARLRDYLEEA